MSGCMFCNSNSFKQLGSYRCNTKKGRKLFKNSATVECTECHSIQISPIPSVEELTEYYTGFYRFDDEHNHVKLEMFPTDNIWYLSRGRAISKFITRHVPSDSSGTSPRILEIGAGFGYNLWSLRERFPDADIVACEPDPTCKPFLEKLGAETIPFMVNLEVINTISSNDPFDIIVMSHVLEHLINPIEIIRALLGLLKSNGLIMIEVPCCLTAVQNWNIEPHVSFFTPETLRNCIEQSGGSPMHMDTCGPVINTAQRSMPAQMIVKCGKMLLPSSLKKSIRSILGRPDLAEKYDADTLLENIEIIPIKAFNEYGGNNRACIRTLVHRK